MLIFLYTELLFMYTMYMVEIMFKWLHFQETIYFKFTE